MPATAAGNAIQVAAGTMNENYAAKKMLGYDRTVFATIIHVMKADWGLRGDDNVNLNDNGDFSFRVVVIDNMHNYGN
jgi:hypothetical protein